MEQKSLSPRKDLLDKSLYLCNMETYRLRDDFSYRYSIQAIKMSELFSFSEASPFTIMFPPHRATTKLKPMFEDNDENHGLQAIDFLESNDDGVPYQMAVGVFRSQIVFAGGRQYPSTRFCERIYALDTKPKQVNDRRRIMRIEQAKDYKFNVAATGDDHFSTIPFFQSPKGLPKFMEIKGKLYALDLRFQLVYCETGPKHCFEVFDPTVGSWASLPDPPPDIMKGYDYSDRLSYLVAGSKILVANYQTPVYCFDVDSPTQKWEPVSVRYSGLANGVPSEMDRDRQLPMWDSIDLDLGHHMLVVYMLLERLHFFRFSLSNGTAVLEYVATMDVDVKFDHSTGLTYLGGETICCVFMDAFRSLKVRGVIFTFKISFSRSAAAAGGGGSTLISPGSSSDDGYFKISYPSKSLGNSFTAKTLGWRTLEYQFPQTTISLRFSELVGLAVLPLHHKGHALCKVCGSYFLNKEYLNKHLSTNKSCRIELLPLAKCKFCHLYFPRRDLLDHFNISLSCKSKFTEDKGQEDKCFSPYS